MERNILTEIKLGATAFFAALTAWLGILAIPVYILVVLNIFDYWTGITAAPYRGEERTSDKGFRGIAKKVCMWLLVGLGAVMDMLLAYAVATIGISMPFNFLLGAAVAIWLICNEVISIIENIVDIGVEVPGFLLTLAKWVKKSTEEKAEIKEGDKA
ncbi:MAG: phage holin family protein [Angelakisella sp.]